MTPGSCAHGICTSTLQNEGWHGVSSCYYLFGGFNQVTPQIWNVPKDTSYNLTFPSISSKMSTGVGMG